MEPLHTTRLRAMREAVGLSQAEMARRMGYDKSLVSRAERAEIRPWPKFRRAAAGVLEVPEHVLFGDRP